MELYASGFNAWNQLRFDEQGPGEENREQGESDDIRSFTCVLRDDCLRSPRSFLSYTIVQTTAGCRKAGLMPPAYEALHAEYNYLNIAEAANGVSVVLKGDGTTFEYQPRRGVIPRDVGEARPLDLPNVIQVVAYDTGFAALTSTGQVWTWGDERYAACLGREVSDESPAESPGLVTALGDLPTGRITKIAAGGYLLAALTSGNDLYCWGGHPARPHPIEGIGSDPEPVTVEEQDIADVALGESHVILLTTDGEIFVIGDNTNGQLGLNIGSTPSWLKIDLHLDRERKVVGVSAGPRSSLILVREFREK